MQEFTLPLTFTLSTTEGLRREQNALADAFKSRGKLDSAQLASLRAALAAAIGEVAGDPNFLQRLRDNIRPNLLHLTTTESDGLLNLPWHLAAEGSHNLLISKGLPLRAATEGLPELEKFQPHLPLPLKILVMIASPDHRNGTPRLDHETEEKVILDALSELIRSGQVEVEFCDGDLPSLRRSLADNEFHILYFSGHSAFLESENPTDSDAVLLLEDEFSMQERPTPAAEFAKIIAADPKRQPALVFLSSCQSGVGSATQGFRGVAHRLMQAGVPAVIGMGWSVTDFWATQFAGAFFRELAAKKPLGESFNRALETAQQLRTEGILPEFFQSQALIPQLFLTKKVSHLVEWQGKSEKRLARAANNLLRGDDGLARKLKKIHTVFGREGKDLLFIGRRRERKRTLAALRDGRSVLLRGQGGMGKTALALHLAWRKLVADPDGCLPLAFDQTSLSLESICNALLDFLTVDAKKYGARTEIAKLDKQWDKFYYLLEQTVSQGVTPFFIFDNLESFQPNPDPETFQPDDPGGALRPEIAELLNFFLTQLGYPVLCTGRYPLREFDSETLAVVDLNEAPAVDFRQKCLHLPDLRRLEVEGRDFDSIAKTLHGCLGGNYRSLEDFDELCRDHPQDIPNTLDELENLIQKYAGEALRNRAKDLIFEKLVARLTPAERRALLLLAEFRRPVLPFAVEWQDKNLEPAEVLLGRAADLTLAERRTGEVEGWEYFFVAPLVRGLLKDSGFAADGFDDERAGAYFEEMQKQNQSNYFDFETAFFHYEKRNNIEKLNKIGTILCSFYFQIQAIHLAFDYAKRVEELAGNETDEEIQNTLGLIFQIL